MISKERRQAIEDTLARSSMPEYLTIEADDGETLCVLTKHQLRTLLDHADEAVGLLRSTRWYVDKMEKIYHELGEKQKRDEAYELLEKSNALLRRVGGE